MSKTFATVSKNVVSNSVIQDTNVIAGLKFLATGTNVTTVISTQGKKLTPLLLSLTYLPIGISCTTRTSTCFRFGGIHTSIKIWIDISVKWKETFRGYLKINGQNDQNW